MKKTLFILVFVLIVLICTWFFSQKENKAELAKYYKITKPTLQKWVQHFPCRIQLKDWNKKRKLTKFEALSIKHQWGEDSKMVLNKGQIAEQASSTPKTVAKYVIENLEKIGLTQEAWDKCSVFPPTISQRIIDLLIGKPEPTIQERINAVLSN